jgi:hypothetical protein
MRRKRRRAARAGQTRSDRPRAEDLTAESRALLGEKDTPRRMRPEPAADASVEDPLRDWPED